MLGVIGGSGIHGALAPENTRTEDVSTPYGDPSAPPRVGEFAGEAVVFLPRHGEHHQYSPAEVPYRANVHALKQLGVERVVAVNAVGSLREGLPPRTLVVPDQLVDRTKRREESFFGDGIVVHVRMADPHCPHMADHLAESARAVDENADAAADVDVDCERGGTYVCIEGPQYATRAESAFYRRQGWDVVGMTASPEAKLAREAELCYATVAGVTDFDAWKTDSDATAAEVLENAAENEAAIEAVLERAVQTLPAERNCDCATALEGAVSTPAAQVSEDARERVDLLVGDYLE